MFIYLAALGLSCSIWDIVPRPGIEPRLPALGVCGVLATKSPSIQYMLLILLGHYL